MNKVWIILKNGKILTVRSTETLAEIAVNIEKHVSPKAKYKIEGWDVLR